MTATRPMTPLRRPMPGMPGAAPQPPSPTPAETTNAPEPGESPSADRPKPRRDGSGQGGRRTSPPGRHRVDYSATHLANFRLPTDLHRRYGKLIAEAQERHPRLRKMSLTEVLVALLAEGPQTADEVAELVRRKRADEHDGRA